MNNLILTKVLSEYSLNKKLTCYVVKYCDICGETNKCVVK